jgi:hypothetical protein
MRKLIALGFFLALSTEAGFAMDFPQHRLPLLGNIHQIACTPQQAQACSASQTACHANCRPEYGKNCHIGCCMTWKNCVLFCGSPDNLTNCMQ